MSWPVFKDFDKAVADDLDDDFDTKFSLKVKSAGPYATTLTGTTVFKESKEGVTTLVPKLALKYVHASGFTVDKFEVTQNGASSVETSLANALPNTKLEFKGNDSDKADLSFKHVAARATVTGEVDIYNFQSAKLSVCSGHGDITFGANADLKLDKMALTSSAFGLGVGYKIPNIFVGLRANNNASDFGARWSYSGFKGVEVAGDVGHNATATNAAVVGSVKVNPNTALKVKVATNNGGILYASCKQSLPNKASVTASAEVPSSFNSVKFGLNATLG